MRLLILDGSRVLHSLIRRLAPAEVELERALTFEEAASSFENDPPDAAIVNLTASDLPWRELNRLCQAQEPPIPVLFESCVYGSADEAGLGRLGEAAAFLAKPYQLADLQNEIERLLLLAGSAPVRQSRHCLSPSAPEV
jgi:DNA-binding response OmpR family regulator